MTTPKLIDYERDVPEFSSVWVWSALLYVLRSVFVRTMSNYVPTFVVAKAPLEEKKE